jgi:YHS domain-containing protein
MQRQSDLSLPSAKAAVRRIPPRVLAALGIAALALTSLLGLPLRSTQASPVISPGLRPAYRKIALDGYCPVALTDKRAWRKGDDRYRITYEGCVYRLSGPDEQAAFVANPSQYAAVLCGCDVVMAKDRNLMIDGQREHGLYYQGQTYLFVSEKTLQRFQQDPQAFSVFAQENHARLADRFIENGPDREDMQVDTEVETAGP